jgi:hypothetical protein
MPSQAAGHPHLPTFHFSYPRPGAFFLLRPLHHALLPHFISCRSGRRRRHAERAYSAPRLRARRGQQRRDDPLRPSHRRRLRPRPGRERASYQGVFGTVRPHVVLVGGQ